MPYVPVGLKETKKKKTFKIKKTDSILSIESQYGELVLINNKNLFNYVYPFSGFSIQKFCGRVDG